MSKKYPNLPSISMAEDKPAATVGKYPGLPKVSVSGGSAPAGKYGNIPKISVRDMMQSEKTNNAADKRKKFLARDMLLDAIIPGHGAFTKPSAEREQAARDQFRGMGIGGLTTIQQTAGRVIPSVGKWSKKQKKYLESQVKNEYAAKGGEGIYDFGLGALTAAGGGGITKVTKIAKPLLNVAKEVALGVGEGGVYSYLAGDNKKQTLMNVALGGGIQGALALPVKKALAKRLSKPSSYFEEIAGKIREVELAPSDIGKIQKSKLELEEAAKQANQHFDTLDNNIVTLSKGKENLEPIAQEKLDRLASIRAEQKKIQEYHDTLTEADGFPGEKLPEYKNALLAEKNRLKEAERGVASELNDIADRMEINEAGKSQWDALAEAHAEEMRKLGVSSKEELDALRKQKTDISEQLNGLAEREKKLRWMVDNPDQYIASNIYDAKKLISGDYNSPSVGRRVAAKAIHLVWSNIDSLKKLDPTGYLYNMANVLRNADSMSEGWIRKRMQPIMDTIGTMENKEVARQTINDVRTYQRFKEVIDNGVTAAAKLDDLAKNGDKVPAEYLARLKKKVMIGESKKNEIGQWLKKKDLTAEEMDSLSSAVFDDAGLNNAAIAEKFGLSVADLPTVKAVVRGLRDVDNEIIDTFRKLGVLDEDTVNRIIGSSDFYASLRVELTEEAEREAKLLGKGTSNLPKEMGFSDNPNKMSPDVATTMNAASMVPYAYKQKYTRDVVNALRRDFPGVVEELAREPKESFVSFARRKDADPSILSYLENGEWVDVKITDKFWLNTIKNNPKNASWIYKGFKAMSDLYRSSVVYVPTFAFRNFVKDIFAAAMQQDTTLAEQIQTMFNREFLGDLRKAANNALGAENIFAKELKEYGVGGELFRHGKKSQMENVSNIDTMLNSMMGVKQPRLNTGFIANVKHGIDSYKYVMEAVEKMPRYLAADQSYQRELAKLGYSAAKMNDGHILSHAETLAKRKAMAKAASMYRDVTANFGEAGSAIRGAGGVVPFFSASFAGPRATFRAATKMPTEFFAKGAVLITAPTVALWMKNKDELWYQDLDTLDKTLNWHITENFKIPKPFQLGIVFASIPEMTLNYVYGSDTGDGLAKQKAIDMAGELWKGMLPFDPTSLPMPPLFNAAWGWLSHQDPFTRAFVIPPGQIGQQREEQYGVHTSELAKRLSSGVAQITEQRGMVNATFAPANLDYGVNKLLGPIASKGVLPTADYLFQKAMSYKEGKPFIPPKSRTTAPWLIPFQSPDVGTTFATFGTREFFKLQNKFQKLDSTITRLEGDGNYLKADRLRAAHEKELYAYQDNIKPVKQYIKDLMGDYNELSKPETNMWAGKKLTRATKLLEMDKIMKEANKEMKQAATAFYKQVGGN